MKKFSNKKATSIAEAMVVMLIIVSGVTGMYNIYKKSIDISTLSLNKIQAIQIATQGVEAISNIRDTNWKLFPSDYDDCWNVLNYNSACIGDNTQTFDIPNDTSFIVYKDTDNVWNLNSKSTGSFGVGNYNNDFSVGLDSDGIYTQGVISSDLKTFFTREIKISYLRADGVTAGNSNDPKMKIVSLVQWVDNTAKVPHKVELEQILSNWKK